MKPRGDNVVSRIVSRGICSGCGVCAGLCPHGALTMGLAGNGDLVVHATGDCSGCGLCLQVCPFATGVHDPRSENGHLYRPPRDGERQVLFHEHAGWFLRTFVGFSELHRPTSASGGLLTLCLEQLLCTEKVDIVAVVAAEAGAAGLRFAFRAVSSARDLRLHGGSVYFQVEASSILRQMLSGQHRWAVIGVPCLCSALRNAMRRVRQLGTTVRYVLGLACGMYQNRMYTELLCAASGVPLSLASEIKYRVKPASGPASNFGFCAGRPDGSAGRPIPYRGLPLFLGRNAYFRCNSCNFCRDVFAESADACFFDAWVSPYREDPRGTSMVIMRAASLDSLFDDITRAVRGVHIVPATVDMAVASQAAQIRRKRCLSSLRTGDTHAARLSDRFDWWLQRRTQMRSKSAWARWGRGHGLAAFWLAMADLWFLQVLAFAAHRLGQRLRAAVRRAKRLLESMR